MNIDISTIGFLAKLKENNSREWFAANRPAYLKAKENFELFIDELIVRITEFDPILKGLEAKNCIFRINRDTRFSNDKSPYKTNMGAFIVRGGKKNGDRYAGYYIHLEPGSSMIAGGAYMPPAPWLNAIREKVAGEGQMLNSIINEKNFVKFYKSLEGEKVKTAPKGYSRDHQYIELLKHKSYIVMRNISDKEITDRNFISFATDACRAMKPLNDFLSEY